MQDIIAKLTAKDDKYACAIADKIISESQDTDEWYEYFDTFSSLLNHPKSLVRNRVLYILSANAQVGVANHNIFREYYYVCMMQIYRNIKIVCVH